MRLERLAAPIRTEVDGEGRFTAMASVLASTALGERGPTKFQKGAFAESLKSANGRFPLLWQHHDDEPVGVAYLKETDEGLALEGVFAMDVTRAREAHSLLKMRAIDGVSIGFTAEKARFEKHGGRDIRVVEQARLAEASLVTFPADREARVRTVHSEWDELENAADTLIRETAAAEAEMETHEGRVFSSTNLAKLREALGSLVDLVQKVDPQHIVTLGRKATRMAKKSFIFRSKPVLPPASVQRNAALRRAELLMIGACDVATPVAPKAKTFDEIAQESERREAESRLFASIDSILSDPTVEDKAAMLRRTVEQYLVASGAEAVDEGQEEVEEPVREKGGDNVDTKETPTGVVPDGASA